jgi:hypothetical protein
MAEEGLQVCRDGTLGGLLYARKLVAVASGPVWRLHDQFRHLILGFSPFGRLDAPAQGRLGRLWRLGRIVYAVGGAHGGLIRHVERIERALQVLVVVILLRLAVLHGQQSLGQQELLHLGPCSILLLAALELHAVCDFAGSGRDLVEPLDGFAAIGVDTLGACLEALDVSEGWWYG